MLKIVADLSAWETRYMDVEGYLTNGRLVIRFIRGYLKEWEACHTDNEVT